MVSVFYNGISENATMFTEDLCRIDADRRDFVHNVGVLAAQTREGVQKIEYYHKDQLELAYIHFKGGVVKEVNISHNSFRAIVLDIFKNL